MQEDIVDVLIACRKQKGWSQEQIADALHVHRTIINKIERRVIKAPSYTIVKEWGRVTGCEEKIAMHMSGGRDGWKKLSKLEAALQQAKSALDLVNFMKRGKVAMRDDKIAGIGELRSRV